jgi:hypothetical protein
MQTTVRLKESTPAEDSASIVGEEFRPPGGPLRLARLPAPPARKKAARSVRSWVEDALLVVALVAALLWLGS